MNFIPYVTEAANAKTFDDWLRNRGGIAIWQSADLTRAAQNLATPATTKEGEPYPKPDYWVREAPTCIITDPADVIISNDVEVKRFHVGLRMGDGGLRIKCTDGASRRIREAVAKAGEGAYHTFDYATQEAVIMKPESQFPLPEFLSKQPLKK